MNYKVKISVLFIFLIKKKKKYRVSILVDTIQVEHSNNWTIHSYWLHISLLSNCMYILKYKGYNENSFSVK